MSETINFPMGESCFAILSHLCPRLDGYEAFLNSGFHGRERKLDGPCDFEGGQRLFIKGGSTTRSTGRLLGQPSPDSDKLPPEVAVMHSIYSSSIFFKP